MVEQYFFTYNKCYSLLDKKRDEQMEITIFCDLEDQADFALGKDMAPALIAGELSFRKNDSSTVPVLVADYVELIPGNMMTPEEAVRMFSEECKVCANLLAKGSLVSVSNKRAFTEISSLCGVPRPSLMRRIAV